MSEQRFQSFEEFWPYYVREHSKKTTRALHFIGTTGALACVAAAVITKRKAFLLAAPIFGYGFAWVSHFFVEHNKPATFKYPGWSLRGDFVMWAKTIAGTMDAEVERATSSSSSNGAHEEPAATGASAEPSVDPSVMN